MKLVSANTIASTISTMPNVPVMVWVKYNAAKMIATITRIVLSVEPMFFIIVFKFRLLNNILLRTMKTNV